VPAPVEHLRARGARCVAHGGAHRRRGFRSPARQLARVGQVVVPPTGWGRRGRDGGGRSRTFGRGAVVVPVAGLLGARATRGRAQLVLPPPRMGCAGGRPGAAARGARGARRGRRNRAGPRGAGWAAAARSPGPGRRAARPCPAGGWRRIARAGAGAGAERAEWPAGAPGRRAARSACLRGTTLRSSGRWAAASLAGVPDAVGADRGAALRAAGSPAAGLAPGLATSGRGTGAWVTGGVGSPPPRGGVGIALVGGRVSRAAPPLRSSALRLVVLGSLALGSGACGPVGGGAVTPPS
jgi:hypothetical protein